MKWVGIIIFLLLTFNVKSQLIIQGIVNDFKEKPLKAVNVLIKNSYDGATTDSLGRFSFTTFEKGVQVLEATLAGYSIYQKNILLDKPITGIKINIKELITELNAVVITAGTFEASDQKKSTVLNSIDIVTTASANADITAAIKTLPGTQQVGETEGLFVRGGTAGETKTFIDGTLVNNFFYSSQPGLAQRGRFNPFLFKGTVFSAGGYSALYGQALSSVLLLESIDLPERSSADLAISYLGVGGGLQHLAKNKKSSWGISYNYTDLRLVYNLVKQTPDYFNVPVLHGGDGNFRIKTKNGMLKYYGTMSSTNVGFRYADIDSAGMKNAFTLKNLNTYQNISWKERLGAGYRLQAGASYSTNKDELGGQWQDENNMKQSSNLPWHINKNFGVNVKGHYANAKIVMEKKLSGLNALRAGTEYNYSKENTLYTRYDSSQLYASVPENLLAFFAESDFYLSKNLAAKIGIRTEHSTILDKWNVAPRLSLAYKFKDNSQASFAYGLFYQNPEKKYFPASTILDYTQAQHFILQYQKIKEGRIFRTEFFYKKYNNLVKTNTSQGRETALNNSGYGNAKGVEIFIRDKKTIKNVDYWISYSYLDTKRDFQNYPTSIEPAFAAKHTASLVVKKFVTKLKTMVNGSYSIASGRPYYNIRYDNNTGKNKIYDEGRTHGFNSMSFSLNYLPNIGKTDAKKFTVFVFSITNVLGTNNIFTYNYSYDGQVKQAVQPPSKRFFYLGCFLSFGIDRTQDAINNNL
ncbi:MAG: carboxypeptidase-like regulatory domain-containing protein [Ferruginibacter sp.]